MSIASSIIRGGGADMHTFLFADHKNNRFKKINCTHIDVYCSFRSGFLPGFDVALATMRKGEISRFIFSPDYAYREMGCPPRIPPNASGKQFKVANAGMLEGKDKSNKLQIT